MKISDFLKKTVVLRFKSTLMEYPTKDIKIIKISLIIIASVVVMFVLRLFSFIFIPLFLALFIALLLLPLLDWFARKKIPNWLGIVFIILISVILIWVNVLIFQNTASELYASKSEIMKSANEKINPLWAEFRQYMGLNSETNQSSEIIDVEKWLNDNSRTLINQLSTFITGVFMTIFFLSLFLTGANLFEVYISKISDDDKNIIQTFRNIIDTLNGFIKVKFFVSLLTGILFGIIVMSFGVKFALFWGVMAFLLNFVQLIGSFFITTVLILFGFVEINSTGNLLLFGSLLIATQVIVGGIMEPILMGKSFKINTISILISLSIWGFVFGIAGLVLAIPIMVFLKMILERIPATQRLASLMNSVNEPKRKNPTK
jgi:AI-2 transport protein TqsA